MIEKIDQVQKQVDEIADQVADNSLAFSLIQELSESNKRLENANERLDKSNKRKDKMIMGAFLIMLAMVVVFFIYLYQYDYSVEATGVFAMVDSNGNIIAHDFSEEEMQMALDYVMESRAENGYN